MRVIRSLVIREKPASKRPRIRSSVKFQTNKIVEMLRSDRRCSEYMGMR